MAVLILVLGAYTFVQSNNRSTSPTSSTLTFAVFSFQNVSILIPQGQLPPCQASGPQGPLPCTSSYGTDLNGTVFVNANSPLSCIEVYVNGTSEGFSCWNLTAAGFPYTNCFPETGNGSQSSCTTVIEKNNNTQLTRTIPFDYRLQNGTNDTPLIMAGRPYLITLMAQFQDGTISTVSVTTVPRIIVINSTNTATSG